MEGAVAAGHPLSAEAGAEMLRAGGNAVDACVAAAFAGAVCEGPLTGLGAGGFMLVHRRGDGRTRLADFFVAAPGLGGAARRGGAMREVDVRFGDGATSQPFRVGCASVAVPGAAAGLEAVHRRYGRMPWRELVVPACRLARAGVTLTAAQAHIHAILDPILRSTPEGQRLYTRPDGAPLGTGDRLVHPDLAETLEELGRSGAAALYRGERAAAIVSTVAAGGGELTSADLAAYRVVWRRPVEVSYAGHRVHSNPPPSAGGILIAYALALLSGQPLERPGSAAALVQLIEAMREQARARDSGFSSALRRGGLARRLLSPESLERGRRRLQRRAAAVLEPAPAGGTTQVSVLDAEGNAASFSSSTGSGSGVIVPGTGIYLNNMLGEDDLVGAGPTSPGRRLTSMMAPTIVLAAGGEPRLVVGSAGSARLRGAILQTVVNVLNHRLDVGAAIDAPRLHVEGELVHCEGGHSDAALERLARHGYELVRWQRRNLFFGGVAAVERRPGGACGAAGDPRRGGAGVLVA
jgi:gamma-glutamyltranspeptidase/glutathione hydrolase